VRNFGLILFLCSAFLCGALAWGQGKPATPPGKSPAATADDDDHPIAPAPASAANIGPHDPVLTVKGLCPETSPKAASEPLTGKDCSTVITREQFEKIARAIQPSLSPVVKRQLVALYPRLLIMSREAEARGIDKDEHFQQVFDFARMQILTQQLTHRVQQEAGKIPEADIEDYYKKNPDSFREYTFERIYIPRMKQEPPPAQKLTEEAENEREKNAEDAMVKLAGEVQKRAVAGEPFEALQKEAYQSAGLKTNPPNASMGMIRSNGLPPAHSAALRLKVGEVSQVLNDAGGHYIYKLDSSDMESLAEAKVEIHNALQSQRLHSMMDKIQAPFSTDVNDAYFGPAIGKPSGDNDNDDKGDEKPGGTLNNPLAPK
jgi:hypothetical protein